MKRSAAIATGAALLLASAFAARAQDKISDGVVKIGMLEDMSSIYADITGTGAVMAAKMAVEDFGGSVLGKPIEVVAADHQNKPDIASPTAREWFDNQHVDALMDVAASATALAAIEVARPRTRSSCSTGRARSASPMKHARQSQFIIPMIITRSPTAPAPPWSRRAMTLGFSLPPTMPSATILKR